MKEMKIAACPESVVVLETFAEAIPKAVQDINECTQRLINTFLSLSDDMGEHAQAFQQMLDLIKRAQDEAGEALMVLPAHLKASAEAMEAYLKSQPSLPNIGSPHL